MVVPRSHPAGLKRRPCLGAELLAMSWQLVAPLAWRLLLRNGDAEPLTLPSSAAEPLEGTVVQG